MVPRDPRSPAHSTLHPCLKRACGFYLADGANEPVVRTRPTRRARFVEHDMCFAGTYNGNCPHRNTASLTHAAQGMCFLVSRPCDRDVAMLNARTYASCSQRYRVVLQDILIETVLYDVPDRTAYTSKGPAASHGAQHPGRLRDDLFRDHADDGARGKMSESTTKALDPRGGHHRRLRGRPDLHDSIQVCAC